MAYGDDSEHYISFSYGNDFQMSRRRKVGIRFDRQEIRELSIATGVLTLAFAFVFSGSDLLDGRINFIGMLLLLPFSFIAVLTGFALHELGHKISANIFGYPAAFSYSQKMLLLGALISVVIGFLVAAPGAVVIYGRPSRKENGIISAAGPGTNLLIGGTFFILAIPGFFIDAFIGNGLMIIAIVNLFLGAFNMIPIRPFDGSKIWRWSKAVYVILASLLVLPLLFLLGIIPILG
ncbi:MAG: site-2 protease family protein [Thermoplasmatota archaeon]